VADLPVSPGEDDAAAELVRDIRAAGGQAVATTADIGQVEQAEAMIQFAIDTWGSLDVLVSNAGNGRPGVVWTMGDEDWSQVLRVHLDGTFYVTRAAARWWRGEAKQSRGGPRRLITTGSAVLLRGGSGQANYAAAKAGIVAFTESVATELAPYGVTANCIFPTARTRLMSTRRGEELSQVDGGEAVDPVHSARLVRYLASVESGWVSGKSFRVFGRRVELVRTFEVTSSVTSQGDPFHDVPVLFGAAPYLRGEWQ